MFEYKLKQVMEQHGKEATLQCLGDAIAEGKFNPARDFSIRRLAEAFHGPNWAEELKTKRVMEGPEAVSASALTAISGQLMLSIIKDAYRLQPTIGDQLVTTIGVSNNNLGPEIVGYISSPFDIGQTVQEQETIPATQVTGQYLTLPKIEKFGRLIHLSYESIFADKTGELVQQAQAVGQWCALSKEYQILNVVLGYVNNYIFNGTSINTYNTAPNANYVNKITSFSLNDYSDINTLEQTILNQVDPISKQPIELLGRKQVLVVPQSLYKLKTILNANQVRSGPFATSGDPIGTYSNNPLDGGQYEVMSSIYVQKVLSANGMSYSDAANFILFGNISKAFMYREARPLEVTTLPVPNVFSFENDVVMSIRALFMGSCGVYEPRAVALGVVS
jgi:hypothetical protein